MQKHLRFLTLLLALFVGRQANAQLVPVYTNLSAFGATWKYLDNGTNAGTTWKDSTFSDASWSSGASYLGYGDPWIITCVNSGCAITGSSTLCAPTCTNKNITTYFRRKITLTNPAQYDSMRIGVVRDDGAVIYVNGVEVVRSNMPTGTITYTTGAAANVGGTAESTAYYYVVPKSYFVNGDNYIAVEVHNDVATSSDQTFNFQLEGVNYIATPITLSRGPYLQVLNKTGITVRWRSNVAAASRVQIGLAPGAYTSTILQDTGKAKLTEHIVRVDGLLSDTKYYYRIGSDTSFLQGDSANFFTTAPNDTTSRKMTFAMFGDCGRNDLNYQTNALASYFAFIKSKGMSASDLLIMNGDNAYNNGTDAEYQSNLFNAYQGSLFKNHPLFSAPGNHDYDNGALAAQQLHNVPYFKTFSSPTNGECGGVPSGTQAYYSHNYGSIHFLSLDSYGMEDYGTTRMYDTNGRQVQWIKADLAANTKPWVICYWHHPAYTMGSHNSDNEAELVKIRQNFIQILERMGVDMIMTGHSHDYERSMLMRGHYGNEATFNKAAHTTDSSSAKYDGSANSCPYQYKSGKINHGTVYVVAGSAGASGGVQAGYPHDSHPFSFNDGGMFYFEVQGNRLDAKWIRRDSVIADQFTIVKDAHKNDTFTINQGASITLNASYPGSYTWSNGAATKTITVAPGATTVYTVKDSATNTCLADQFTVLVIPATTGVPTVVKEDDAYIYPVPAQDVLHFEMQNTNEGQYKFTVTDLDGRTLQSFTKYLDRGRQAVTVDVKALPVGQVLMLTVDNNRSSKTFRFTRKD